MPKNTLNTTAVVCSHTDYSDTSLVLALYTKELGKIHALARGVKKKRGDMARLELLHEVTLELREPSSASSSRLYTLSGQPGLETAFCGLRADMAAFAAGTYASELVMSLVPFEEPDEEIYAMFRAFLAFANVNPQRLRVPLMAFELRLMNHCGFGLDGRGRELARALAFLAQADFEAAQKLNLNAEQEDKIASIIRSALDFHLEKTLKSFSFMQETLCKRKKQNPKN